MVDDATKKYQPLLKTGVVTEDEISKLCQLDIIRGKTKLAEEEEEQYIAISKKLNLGNKA